MSLIARMLRLGVLIICFLLPLATQPVRADLDLDTSAAYFGQLPDAWGMRLSPDGQKVTLLKVHPDGFPIALVVDLKSGKSNLVLASEPKRRLDLTRCEWASSSRLLCEYFGMWRSIGAVYPITRLVAVDIDGKNPEVLVQREQLRKYGISLIQSDIIDRLPDDPRRILLKLPARRGYGVSRVDIHKNRSKTIERAQNGVWKILSDGRGEIRIRSNDDRLWWHYEYRLSGEDRWRKLHRYQPEDDRQIYSPAAIVPGSNELFVWDWHEGRRALFKEWLVEDSTLARRRELVMANDQVDLSAIVTIGKYQRPVGVLYRTEKPYIEYFDEVVDAVSKKMATRLDGRLIHFLDESWDRRYYLLYASSDTDAGAYYRYDKESDVLSMIAATHPWLNDVVLAPMTPIRYPAKDGTSIPGYLTKPGRTKGRAPLVVFANRGRMSRDDWGYDRLPQFLASRGYAVLQANYRGSDGYGDEWFGEGGFKAWRTMASDVDAGVAHLIESGIVDANRICIAGWNFGGYTALITALEFSSRYRCVVSVGGVTHPHGLATDVAPYSSLERLFARHRLPSEAEDIVRGSPLRRANEMSVPTLLIHGELDGHVRVDHSRDLERALRKAGKAVEYVEYPGADSSIRRQKDRIDMLQRIGDFLDRHLGEAMP